MADPRKPYTVTLLRKNRIVQIAVYAVSERDAMDSAMDFLQAAQALQGKRYRVFADRICRPVAVPA